MERLPRPREEEPCRQDAAAGPVDPDLGPEPAFRPGVRSRARWWRDQGLVLAVVALGGTLGAWARYAATLLWPTPAGTFPWTILLVNVTGCALMGAFMVLLTDAWAAHRLVRPFFGTGVLGGYTTFSTYAVDIRGLLEEHRPGLALGVLALTPATALAAVWLTATLTRRLIARRRP
ncbi:fluoride efflux transporter FluC [Streptomyces albus]|uniref:fluoride efflux transporter FluC n=1 Tax=unclassified Streptomyces TaxID=2593676 RepID=UPI0004BD01BF|nr:MULTISPECIES: CrcB family protein [unclassified Streptomyces]